MKTGSVLSRSEASEANRARRLTGSGQARTRPRNILFGSMASFFICLALVVLLDEDGRVEGLRALGLLFAILGLPISALVGIVVTGYIIVRWFMDAAQPSDGPQDSVETAVLTSMSVFPLILLAGGWVFFMIVGSAVLGLLGFLGTAVGGLAVAVAAVYLLGVLDQRIEVKPHEVRVRMLGTKRTIPAGSITDISFAPVSFSKSPQRFVVVERKGKRPLYLGGRFVSDAVQAERFVADARHILRLDVPQDA